MSTKDIIKQILNKMGFECQLKVMEDSFINIQVQEPGLLIGQNGNNIRALQHLARIIIMKNYKILPQFTLDINNYRQQKTNFLKKLAQNSAYRACILKKEIILKPMSAYDRRLVYLELSARKDVVAESQGEEPNRCIIIRSIA